MPRRSGFTRARPSQPVAAVSGVVNSRRPPTLFITGYGASEDAVRLLKLGAADYLTKPFDPGTLAVGLLAWVARALPREGAGPDVNSRSPLSGMDRSHSK